MNKKILIPCTICLFLCILISILAINLSQKSYDSYSEKGADSFENYPYLKIPVIDAFYEGEKTWFIHTDVSDSGMAKRLTNMVNFPTLYSSYLGKISTDKAGKIYVFTNGLKQDGVKPWSGGPFKYQIDIIDSIPGDENYTPIRNPYMVTWKEGVNPRILKSMQELEDAEKAGELLVKKTNVIVNVPIVKWPSNYLGGESRITE